MDATFLCLIHEINTKKSMRGKSQNLQYKSQISFQTDRITDDNYKLRIFLNQEIPGNFFFSGGTAKGIAARQVYNGIELVLNLATAVGKVYCFSRPVACVLMKPGKRIKNRAFSYIGISCQGYHGNRRKIRVFHKTSLWNLLFFHCNLPESYGRPGF